MMKFIIVCIFLEDKSKLCLIPQNHKQISILNRQLLFKRRNFRVFAVFGLSSAEFTKNSSKAKVSSRIGKKFLPLKEDRWLADCQHSSDQDTPNTYTECNACEIYCVKFRKTKNKVTYS